MRLVVQILIFLAPIAGLLAWNLKTATNEELLANDSEELVTRFQREVLRYLDTGVKSQELLDFYDWLYYPRQLRYQDLADLSREDSVSTCDRGLFTKKN